MVDKDNHHWVDTVAAAVVVAIVDVVDSSLAKNHYLEVKIQYLNVVFLMVTLEAAIEELTNAKVDFSGSSHHDVAKVAILRYAGYFVKDHSALLQDLPLS